MRTRGLQEVGGAPRSRAQQVQGLGAAAAAAPHVHTGCRHCGTGSTFRQQLPSVALSTTSYVISLDSILTWDHTLPLVKDS